MNPNNNDNICFKYVVTVVLNHESIGKNPQRTSKTTLFIDWTIGKT